ASLGDLFARLDSPARVTLAPGATGVTGLALSVPGGAVTGRATLHADGVSGDLAVRFADIAPMAAAAGQQGLGGALDADARFDTRPGAATADVRLAARRLTSAALLLEQGQGFDVDAGLDWRRGTAAVELTATGPMVERPLRIEASLPLRATGGLLPAPPRGAQVAGSADWRGRIGDLWALAPAADHVLDGDLTVALTFAGPLEGPEFSGELSLADGVYQNLTAGTIIANLSAQSQVDPDGAFAITLQGDDGSGRPVQGRARLAGGQVDARITADEAVLVRRDDVTAAISADIAVAGPLAGPTVSGPVTVNRAEVRLVNTTPPGVDDIGPVRVKGEPPPPPPGEDGGAVALDMTVRAPGNIFVRGRGLDSEWRMDLRIGGGAAAPRVTGVIERVRGQLTLVGAIFNLDRGAVRFDGGPDIDPALDVALIRDAGDVSGGIVVNGAASRPAISFQSTPALPEGEVLPRVLFGKSQQSLTPAEALQLATGLATLLDGSGGLLDGVRGAAGLDVLRVEGLGEDAGVTIGRNVADGVFVGARQPIDGGSASVTVEIEVFDNFSVDTEVGAERGNSFGLNWKRDF
ncbi:MAG: translocation/assembly module TamB domain-containing protein, partial [Rubrimonas sp.]